MHLAPMFADIVAVPTMVEVKPTRADAHDVAKSVAKHCRLIGCDESNTIAAVAWALKEPGDTLKALRAGKRRAECLRYRQPTTPAIA